MTLKGLVTGLAVAAITGGAAAGVTLIASPAASVSPAVQPVVFGIPLPAAPAPDLEAPLVQTLNGLAGPGSFTGPKGTYVQGGLGRFEARAADGKFNQKAAEGYFPMSFTIANIDSTGPTATANVTATAANGATANQPVTFVTGPSPSGWQISKQSALALLSSVG